MKLSVPGTKMTPEMTIMWRKAFLERFEDAAAVAELNRRPAPSR
jgi:hypothetical protein